MRALVQAVGIGRLLLAPVAGVVVGLLSGWSVWIHAGFAPAVLVATATGLIGLMITLCTVLVVIIAGPHHDRLRSTITSNAAAAWTLDGLLRDEPRPSFGGWAIDAATAAAIVRLVRQPEVKCVLELGPGASTELLGSLSDREGLRLIALEHDESFLHVVAQRLASAPGGASVDLRFAPLTRCELPGWRGAWYDPDAVRDITDVDLLIVDGPPGTRSFGARYPAVPMLLPALRPGALVFVDDAPRREESRMIDRWRADHGLEVAERGANHVLLRTPTVGS